MKHIVILFGAILLTACDSEETPQPSATPVAEETTNPRDCDNLPDGYECP